MNRRDVLEFVGILTMAACTLVFAALWWAAFLGGGTIHVTLVEYSERYPEAAIWFVAAPLMVFGLTSYLRRLSHR